MDETKSRDSEKKGRWKEKQKGMDRARRGAETRKPHAVLPRLEVYILRSPSAHLETHKRVETNVQTVGHEYMNNSMKPTQKMVSSNGFCVRMSAYKE